jgi:hypothetical protein
MFKHYTKDPMADYETQLLHWNSQTVSPNKRTFKRADGKETSTYTSLQRGDSRATALSPEEQESVKMEMQKKSESQRPAAGWVNFTGSNAQRSKPL